MSAILPFLELRPEEREEHKDVLDGIRGTFLGDDLDEKPKKPKPPKKDEDGTIVDTLAKSHTELSRLLWARSLVSKALDGRSFSVELDKGEVYVRISPPVPMDIVPWHKSGSKPLERFKLFSTNSKMQCPTFDLPAGAANLGGACPGAIFAQSTVDAYDSVSAGNPDSRPLVVPNSAAVRYVQKMTAQQKGDENKPIDLRKTVCTYCYATGGKYGEVVVQFSEVARLGFIRAMMEKDQEGLIKLLTFTIVKTLKYPTDSHDTRHGIKPVRLHSSGDFYTPTYAQMWVKVAQRVQALDSTIRIWAPTRTHVMLGWDKVWREAGIPSNFIIRPSAYSLGDRAPFLDPKTGRTPDSPTGSAGTAVLLEEDSRGRMEPSPNIIRADTKQPLMVGDGTKFNHQCGVYDLKKGNKQCPQAIAPDGGIGCRACWVRPDLAVNYVVH